MRMSPFSPIPSLKVAALCAALGFGAACTPSAPPAPPPAPVAAAASTSAIPAVDISTAPAYRKEFGTMWTFDAPPLEYWKNTYGFTPPAGWLDNLRMASVRLPGCSASFVSANGLVMTNHHCTRSCTADVSPADTNYIETGFAAANMAQEKTCPNMYLDQLTSFVDVTANVQAAVTGTTDSAQSVQRTAAIAALERDCNAQTPGVTCQVVTLYNGGRYSLYRYKRYTDVRLVMAPEESAAFFGGDPDNFTFPRWALDVTFIRAYENGQPVRPTNYLRWSPSGAGENELVFVTGNPGSTERLSTVAQLEYNRDVVYPIMLREYTRRLTFNRQLIAQNPAFERVLQNENFSLENSFKAVNGFYGGLKDPVLMNKKRAFEAEVRARVAANPALQAQYGHAWDQIATAVRDQAATYAQLTYYFGGRSEQIFAIARQLISVARNPNDSASARWRETLGRRLVVDTVNIANLTTGVRMQLEAAQAMLPANDPYLVLALQGQTPEAAAARLAGQTKVNTVNFRTALLAGGAAAVDTSIDPMIALLRHADSLEAPLRKRANAAGAIVRTQAAAIGRALYEVYGTNLPPDATFTLRITDGIVKGYPYNGTVASYKSSFYGIFARSADFDNRDPFTLPRRWSERRAKLDMTTPFNFVSTNDIIGGNSGSPVINQNGQIVGLIFDGNIESHPNRFVFTDEVARAVSVHSRAITEALRKLYDAGHLADELEGKASPR